MSVTDGVTLAVGLLTALVALLGIRAQRRIAALTAAQRQQADLAAEQEAVTAEQIKAEDATAERVNRNIWQLIDELQAERTAQQQRMTALEEQVSTLRADLDQVRHVEREQRVRVERLKTENAALREQVERLRAENAALHRRLADLEQKQQGDAPMGPGPAGAPPAIA